MESGRRAQPSTKAGIVHFLPPIRSTKTRRDIELIQSSAKSHLANSWHKRRRQQLLSTSTSARDHKNTPSTIDITGEALSTSQQGPVLLTLGRANPWTHRNSTRANDRTTADGSTTRGFRRPGETLYSDSRYRRVEDDIADFEADALFSATLSMPRQDAWSVVSSDLSDRDTLRLLKHCVNILWPGFNPGKISLHAPPFTYSWHSLISQGPALFHALMWHSAIHLSSKAQLVIADYGSIKHYHHTLQHISQDLQKGTGAMNDATLFAMLSLTTHEPRYFPAATSPESAFDAPFRELQWLHIYSRQPHMRIHLRTVWRLIDLKGGINSLQMPGFASAVQYQDIIDSTFSVSPPHFPINRVFLEMKRRFTRDNYFGHLDEFQDEYSESSELASCSVSENLRDVLNDFRVWSRLLERYGNKTIASPDFLRLAVCRNLLQHTLLCTIPVATSGAGPGQSAETEGEHSDMTEIIRQGLLIFSVGVAFPMMHRPLFQRLAQRLSLLLEPALDALLEQDMQRPVVWLSMLGCLAAVHASDEVSRGWFLNVLARAFVQGDIQKTSWEEVRRSSLEPFVWNSDACDLGGRKIWEDVQRLVKIAY